MTFSLGYVSSATRLFSRAEMLQILADSRANNGSLDVTGALLYMDGNLMQVLEGEEAAGRGLYGRISDDPRHKGVLTLWQGDVDQRSFADWSMAFRELGDENTEIDGYSDFLHAPAGSEFPGDPTLGQKPMLTFKRNM